MAFPSVYEMTNPLTTVRKQHFWEYFSGDSLNARWTFADYSSTGSGAMSDSVDGGYIVTTGSATNARSGITFNDIRPFNYNSSVMIAVVRRNSVASFINSGLSSTKDIAASLTDSVLYENDTSDTYINLMTTRTSTTTTATDVAIHTNYTAVKIETKASSVEMTLDGVLKATSTTNLPTAALQPNFMMLRRASGTANGNISYMECYNT